MAIKLTTKEAETLISMLKKSAEESIELPNASGRIQFNAVGTRRENQFTINISRKGINNSGATFQGRESSNGNILVRLDVNPTAVHINPSDGTRIVGTHLHVYTEEYAMGQAVSFDVGNKDLYELCYVFFEKFNLIEPPKVAYQQRLY